MIFPAASLATLLPLLLAAASSMAGSAAVTGPMYSPLLRSDNLLPWGGPEGAPAEDFYGAIAGSTIQVVRTQATYFTRPAVFGPRIEEPEGLRGILIPILTFYHGPKNPMYACPSNHTNDSDHKGTDDTTGISKHSDPDPKPPADWIALVERGGSCTFVEKVRTAQGLGAIAVVVGDAPSPEWSDNPSNSPEESDPGLSGKRLLTMYATGDTTDISIPSTFITRPSFLDLRRLILELKADYWTAALNSSVSSAGEEPHPLGIEIVLSRDDTVWDWPLIDLALVLLLLPSLMTITTVIVHKIRQAQQRRRERAPELVVHNLPCLIVRGNGQPWEKIEGKDWGDEQDRRSPSILSETPGAEASTSGSRLSYPPATTALAPESSNLLPPGRTWFYSDECAICLSNFVENDRVRVLPCGHIFHRAEIDDWLILQKKICPVCKRDITVPVPPGLPGSEVETGSPSGSSQGTVDAEDQTRQDTASTGRATERTPLLARDGDPADLA
ncbi:hypothetical protein K437DRAFT_276454 [Tilletiaria anomala UBC 951]|uniref:RING-type domain-containing protein n=1 Tax=Tilletiaria anomala (strain ATCC 24038 / CBS 436.72 / UBC 951) TaxID=1037660 RepID=A0A066VGW4_TILAU|nr:uncharacterized protein K437DRAFT_276454 [Tilletiaria anomala UBC 951]KDN37805.1 hypothetical protein K437DRAFT_276454 [Tilletiaria anomala UBC 951]